MDQLQLAPSDHVRVELPHLFGSLGSAWRLVASRSFEKRPNRDATDAFISLQHVPAPMTAYEAVSKLPAGHRLLCENGVIHEAKPYLVLRFDDPGEESIEGLTHELGNLLEEFDLAEVDGDRSAGDQTELWAHVRGRRGRKAPPSCCFSLETMVEPWLNALREMDAGRPTVTNAEIADILEQVASRLEAQHANIYRIDAYRAGAAVVRNHPTSIQELALSEGRAGLDALPQIGSSLSGSIDEIAHTGKLRLLARLEGRLSPVELFKTVPGIGEELAERIHRELDIDTLEALEVAAHDGRLNSVAGFGPRRLDAIREILASMLARSARGRARRFEELRSAGAQVDPPAGEEARPEVSLLLEIDRQYRAKAEADELPRIAPRRNNPEGAAWLPVLHAFEDGWHLTALFSNTDRAHELGRVRDWVVIYFERDGHEGQCTVVTEFRGPLTGERVVRGREVEQPS